MKKIFLTILIIISSFILMACDYRAQLSDDKCQEIYDYVKDSFNISEENDYLYYDYFNDLLLINKSGQLYCNKESSFFENYDYNKYIIKMQYIINNFEPLDITGYRINSKVEYFVNVKYDFNLIKEETNIKINNFNLSLYENLNMGVEIEIFANEISTYSIGIIIGNIKLSKYNQFELNPIILK